MHRLDFEPRYKLVGNERLSTKITILIMRNDLQMTKAADMMYAMCCKGNANNIYVATNKYYEATNL